MDIPIDMRTYTYRIAVLGHYSVGKSSIVLSFVSGGFNQNEESTIGASFLTRTVFQNRSAVKYEIWDTAGQERYCSIVPMYYRNAQAALIVYDATSLQSFETAKKWVEELKYRPAGFLRVLVGNKIDLKDQAVVSTEMGRQYAESQKLMFFETSAKEGLNIQRMFAEIAESLPRETERRARDSSGLRRTRRLFMCC